MAVLHIFSQRSDRYSQQLGNALTTLEASLQSLNDLLGTMALMIDGDPGDPANFTYLATHFSYADNNIAKSAFDELNSLMAKLNTDAQVTSVHAALVQAFDKFR